MKKVRLIFEVLLVLVIAVVIVYIYSKTFVYKTTYMEHIEKSISGSGIDPYLILSIIRIESGFNVNALSSKEAKGLMQIQDATFADMASMFPTNSSLYDPETNIKVGVLYFRKLVSKYNGNYYIALLAYNAGMGNVNSWISSGIIPRDLDEHIVPEIPFKETENYLKKVISTYNIYKLLYNI